MVDSCIQGVPRVVLHHDVGPTRLRHADLKYLDDVRMAAQLAHRALFAHEPFDIVCIEIGGEHLDRNGAVECALPAAVDRAETAASNFLGIGEPGRGQFGRDRRRQITLDCPRIRLDHRLDHR